MKVSICSGDIYYALGLESLASSVPLTHVYCSGEILFFDLCYPGNLRNVNLKNVCHVIYLSNHSYAFELLDMRHSEFDVYYLNRNLNVDEYYNYLSSLILTIMQKKCHWKGVCTTTKHKSISETLTIHEQQIILFALKSINHIDQPSMININIKTDGIHKVNITSKLRIYDHAQFAEFARQTSKISELHDLHKKIIHDMRLSSANICRGISYYD